MIDPATVVVDPTDRGHEASAISVLVCEHCYDFVVQDRHDAVKIAWSHVEGGIGPQIRDRALVDAIEAIGAQRVTLKAPA